MARLNCDKSAEESRRLVNSRSRLSRPSWMKKPSQPGRLTPVLLMNVPSLVHGSWARFARPIVGQDMMGTNEESGSNMTRDVGSYGSTDLSIREYCEMQQSSLIVVARNENLERHSRDVLQG